MKENTKAIQMISFYDSENKQRTSLLGDFQAQQRLVIVGMVHSAQVDLVYD